MNLVAPFLCDGITGPGSRQTGELKSQCESWVPFPGVPGVQNTLLVPPWGRGAVLGTELLISWPEQLCSTGHLKIDGSPWIEWIFGEWSSWEWAESPGEATEAALAGLGRSRQLLQHCLPPFPPATFHLRSALLHLLLATKKQLHLSPLKKEINKKTNPKKPCGIKVSLQM